MISQKFNWFGEIQLVARKKFRYSPNFLMFRTRLRSRRRFQNVKSILMEMDPDSNNNTSGITIVIDSFEVVPQKVCQEKILNYSQKFFLVNFKKNSP